MENQMYRLYNKGWTLTCHIFCLWLCQPWFNYWFSFTLAHSRISHEYSSLFIIVFNLVFMFSLWCIDWVGSLNENRIFMHFCIKGHLDQGWSSVALNPPPPPPPPRYFILLTVLKLWSWCCSYSLKLFTALWLSVFWVCFFLFFFSICVVMVALWSLSSIAAHFAFCFY